MKSYESEQALIYTLLRNGSLLTECDIAANDFESELNGRLYQAINDVAAAGQVVDPVTVLENLERSGRAVGVDVLEDMIRKGWGSEKNVKAYCQNIKSASRMRKARDVAHNLLMRIEEGDQGDPIAEATRELMQIDTAQKNYDRHISECLTGGLEQVDLAHKKGGLVGVSTGLKELDESIGGYHDTDLIVVAARPAMGKTAFMLSSAYAANIPMGIISAEQGNEQAALRLVSIQGSINSQNLRSAMLTDTEWAKLSAAVQALQDRPIWVNDQPAVDIGSLVRQARKWKFNHDIKILFVDYIQKIKGSNRKANKTEQVTEVVGTLKNLARELNIPVVALAQVNRDVDKRTNNRPLPSDLSDASEIEKEADVIMTLYRDEVYNPTTQYPGTAEVGLCKNRHGPMGAIHCQFIGKYFQFKDFNNVRELSHAG